MSTTTTPTPSTTPPATVPASQVIPFPLPWGGIPCPPIPGCAPGCGPAGMDALMKCYMDIKNAMAFISKVMIDLINNDPAVAQAMIAAIEKSGSSLPLIGVTNGADAQPGQVGEWVQFVTPFTFTAAAQNQNVTMGILQPGDWTCFGSLWTSSQVNDAQFQILPLPTGFSNTVTGVSAVSSGVENIYVIGATARALISVPSLIVYSIDTNFAGTGPAAGAGQMFFQARRER